MRESDLWKYVRDGLRGKCHMTRIESSAGNGVPDVSIGFPNKNVWVELKYIPSWPKRPATLVKLPLRPEQKHWIKCRGEMSGDVWVLCRIEDDFFLINWYDCPELVTGVTKEEWFTITSESGNWYKRIDFNELVEELTNGN